MDHVGSARMIGEGGGVQVQPKCNYESNCRSLGFALDDMGGWWVVVSPVPKS